MRAPDTSVVIATYNHGRFLDEAIRSVFAQGLDDLEVLVVDDGSTDGTPEIVSRWVPKVRALRHDNRGLYPTRNRGLSESRGRFVAFLDADDAWEPGALARLRGAFDRRARLAIAAPYFVSIDAASSPLGRRFRKRSPGGAVTTRSLLLTDADVPGCLYRRAALEQDGPFPENNRAAGDYEMWLMLSERWDIAMLPEAILRKRETGGNMSSELRRTLPDKIAAVERFAARAPRFAAEHAGLIRRAQSKNHERLARWCLGSGNPELIPLARTSLDRALALRPFRPKLYRMKLALGWRAWRTGDGAAS